MMAAPGYIRSVPETPKQEATAAGDYLSTLLNRGIEMEAALRLTCTWILAQAGKGAVEEALEKLSDEKEPTPWET